MITNLTPVLNNRREHKMTSAHDQTAADGTGEDLQTFGQIHPAKSNLKTGRLISPHLGLEAKTAASTFLISL